MSRKRNRFLVITGSIALASLLLSVMAGCQGPIGPAGTSSGTLSGTVTNSLTGTALAGATISPDPPVKGAITTSADGTYIYVGRVGRRQVRGFN